MRHVLMLSGGLGSFHVGCVLKNKEVKLDLLFADTLIEDEDLYRFLIQSACYFHGLDSSVWKKLEPFWQEIPPLEQEDDRLFHLMMLKKEACKVIPHFHWLQDGRTPWQLFKENNFLGNSQYAQCSHVLKQDITRSWLEENCLPAKTRLYVGIGWEESHRFFGVGEKKGMRELWSPWKCCAPLCEEPCLSQEQFRENITNSGIAIPRLYAKGMTHNNCGGFCVKAGQAHFRNLLGRFPERYAFHEKKEEEMRSILGKEVSIMRDRRGGKNIPLPMAKLRQQSEEECDPFEWGGCGCFTSEK